MPAIPASKSSEVNSDFLCQSLIVLFRDSVITFLSLMWGLPGVTHKNKTFAYYACIALHAMTTLQGFYYLYQTFSRTREVRLVLPNSLLCSWHSRIQRSKIISVLDFFLTQLGFSCYEVFTSHHEKKLQIFDNTCFIALHLINLFREILSFYYHQAKLSDLSVLSQLVESKANNGLCNLTFMNRPKKDRSTLAAALRGSTTDIDEEFAQNKDSVLITIDLNHFRVLNENRIKQLIRKNLIKSSCHSDYQERLFAMLNIVKLSILIFALASPMIDEKKFKQLGAILFLIPSPITWLADRIKSEASEAGLIRYFLCRPITHRTSTASMEDATSNDIVQQDEAGSYNGALSGEQDETDPPKRRTSVSFI